MIKVPVKTKNGVYRVMRIRVPRTRTFALYRTAEEEAPNLLKQIYAVISQVLEAGTTETVHRSTVLIECIPSDWPFRDQWLKFLDSESARRSLFEQVLWTYFFDREETWETTWPDKDRTDAKYAREATMPPVARAPRPRSKRAAGPTPRVHTRGIGPAATAAIPAAPASAGITAKLRPGDIVEIMEGRYKGLIGEITEVGLEDGFESITVRLPADDEYYNVPHFDPGALKKVR
jgi:KOW motif